MQKMWKVQFFSVLLILICYFLSVINCHIVLTYPPARKYPFDFLDNVRTQGPCGVPKGLGEVTNFHAGQRIHVTWHVAYPHKGGYRLTLLDHKGQPVHQFHSTFIDGHNPTKLYKEITLPDRPCYNCTLQIIREAGEWSTDCPPGQYLFWSCADIHIHPVTSSDFDVCRGHSLVDGRCQCRGGYTGSNCQYKDECEYDTDCNNGRCINTDSTYFPKKQCYCQPGWFGYRCTRRSPVSASNIDYRLYTNTTLSPEFHLYHRMLKEEGEIEIVMRVKSQTWVGLGWRPSDFRSGCQRFPIMPEITPEPESEKSTSEPEPEKSTSEPEPEKSTSEPEPEKSTSEPEPEKSTSEPEPEKSTSEPEPEKSTSEPEPEKSTSEPKPEKSSSEPEPEKSTSEPEPEKTSPEPEPEPCGGSIIQKCNMNMGMEDCYTMSWVFNEMTDTIDFTISALIGDNEWLGIGFSKDKYMTNSDTIYGYHSDGVGTSIYDSHTGAYRAPPMLDRQDIFNTGGSRVNGRTELMFSRKRNTTDDKDFQFSDTVCGNLLIAWGGPVYSSGIGQHRYMVVKDKLCIKSCHVKTTSEPEPEPEPEKTTPESEPETSTEPEPEKPTSEPEPEKSTPEPEPEPCGGSVIRKCTINMVMEDCYTMSWVFHEMSDTIDFTISALIGDNEWLGIGFSKDNYMPNSDTVYGWHSNGNTSIYDSHIGGYHAPPMLDRQDIFNIGGSRVNGRTELTFSRKRNTTDDNDFQFSDTVCCYLLSAWGGPVFSSGIGKHRYKVVNEKLCIKSCHVKTTSEPEPEPEKTTPKSEPETSTEPEPEKSTSEPEPEKSTSEPEPQKTSPEPEPEPCGGSIIRKCTMNMVMEDCYTMSWVFHEMIDTIDFTISALIEDNEWLGIGFSNDNYMPNSDTVYGWHSNGNTSIYDSHVGGYHAPPMLDRQDIFNIGGSRVNGRTELTFSRKRNTTDDNDFQFSNTVCCYLLSAWGGPVLSSGIGMHRYKVVNEKLCIKSCHVKTTSEPEPEKTTSEPEPEKSTSEPEPEKSTSEPEPEKSTSEPEPEKTTSEPESEPCGGSIIRKCSMNMAMEDCYTMSWVFHEMAHTIDFTISALIGDNEWLGIGFSNDNKMPNSDTVYGWHRNGVTSIYDSHIGGYHAPPMLDRQDIFNIGGSRVNGRTELTFSRKRNTTDDNDFQFSDTVCCYLLSAWGGPVLSSGIGMHRYKVVNEKLCIKTCQKPTSEPEPEKTSSEPEPEKSTSEPEPEKSTSEPEPEKSTSEPEPEGSTSEPEGTAVPEGEGEGEPGSCGPPPGVNDTTGDTLHDMDCIDMVIGTAKGQLSRIGDYYSRGRSTPQKDEMFDGRDDLTAAVGFEDSDGFTTIMFRKKITSYEATDHSILDAPMHVIWARGQDVGNYVHDHRTPSGLEDPNANPDDPNYYKMDELKYHGHTGHRGATSFNFFFEAPRPGEGDCKQEWGSCTDLDTCHHVMWMYNPVLDTIHFTLKARLKPRQWIGIGFSNDVSMSRTDAYIAWIDSQNVVKVIDSWTGQYYAMPLKDTKQDAKGIVGSVENGITTISFHRARDTNDDSDIAFTENNCLYMLFPKGGQFTDGSDIFSQHDIIPSVSQQKICIPCQTGTTKEVPTTTPLRQVEKFMIRIFFKVLQLTWSKAYEDKRSEQYRNLKQDMEMSLKIKLSQIRGFITVHVLAIRYGSVQIEAAIEFEDVKVEAKRNIESVMNDIITEGKLGTYTIDDTAGSFSVRDPEAVFEVTTPPPVVVEDDAMSEELWIVVGVAAGGVLLILIFAVCNCVRIHRQKMESDLDEEYKSLNINTSNSNSNGHYDKKEVAFMNLGYDDWQKKHESERLPSFKSQGHGYSTMANENGKMTTF